MTYTPPTQDELDRMIAARLARQEAKIRAEYPGFDEVKAKADKLDQNHTDLQTALDRATAAEAKVASYEAQDKAAAEQAAHDKQVAAWAAEVAKAAHVPAELLRGDSLPELAEHALALQPLFATVDLTPRDLNRMTSDERETVTSLFAN